MLLSVPKKLISTKFVISWQKSPLFNSIKAQLELFQIRRIYAFFALKWHIYDFDRLGKLLKVTPQKCNDSLFFKRQVAHPFNNRPTPWNINTKKTKIILTTFSFIHVIQLHTVFTIIAYIYSTQEPEHILLNRTLRSHTRGNPWVINFGTLEPS